MIRSLKKTLRNPFPWKISKYSLSALQFGCTKSLQSRHLIFQVTQQFSNHERTPQELNHIKEEIVFKSLLEKGKKSMMKGDFNEAERCFQQALILGLKLFGESGQFVGVCYYSLGHISGLRGDRKSGREYYLKSYNILSQDPAKHKVHLLNIERSLGMFSQDSKLKTKELRESKQKLEKELNSLIKEKDDDDKALKLASIYNSLGTICQQEGNSTEGISYKQKALEIYEKSPRIEVENLFFIHLDLGMFYKENRLFNEALESFRKALGVLAEDKSEKAEGLKFIAYHNMGKVYILMRDYQKALDPLGQALEIKEFSKIRDDVVIRTLCHEIGMIYFFLKDGKNSIKYFEKALEAPQKAGDEYIISKLYQNIGEGYMFLEGDITNAKKYFQRALTLMRTYSHGNPDEIKALENIIEKADKILKK